MNVKWNDSSIDCSQAPKKIFDNYKYQQYLSSDCDVCIGTAVTIWLLFVLSHFPKRSILSAGTDILLLKSGGAANLLVFFFL